MVLVIFGQNVESNIEKQKIMHVLVNFGSQDIPDHSFAVHANATSQNHNYQIDFMFSRWELFLFFV